jgi:DnaJ-class molecular chaperone
MRAHYLFCLHLGAYMELTVRLKKCDMCIDGWVTTGKGFCFNQKVGFTFKEQCPKCKGTGQMIDYSHNYEEN